jgi:hypothetical protein
VQATAALHGFTGLISNASGAVSTFPPRASTGAARHEGFLRRIRGVVTTALFGRIRSLVGTVGMSALWHEVIVRGRYRIVAFESDADSTARYAVMTCDGAWLRHGLALFDAHQWLEHFMALDACTMPSQSVPPADTSPHPRTRSRRRR